MQTQESWLVAALAKLETAPPDEPVYSTPEHVTASANMFFREQKQALSVLVLFSPVAIFADNAAFVSKQIVNRADSLPKGFDPFTPLNPSGGVFQKRLVQLSGCLLEMILVRISDNFTSYLSEIVRECLRAKPESLRSKDTVTLEAVLRCESMDELRETLVDRKVDELAYLGFGKLVEWIADRFGAAELSTFSGLATLSEVLEVRNCIVHNRALANAKLIRSSTGLASQAKLGTRIVIDVDKVYVGARASAEFVALTDACLSEKFALPRTQSDKR